MIQKTEAEIMKNWQGDPDCPLVSIRCPAYNQEKHIAQCLDGFLMQETTFPFEAIVHDDASTDGTASIIQEYAEKYPTIIRPIYEKDNQYCKHDGSFSNIINSHLRGKYYSTCEGDDYWIDAHKLQRQFDYMEEHPECSLCSHNTIKHDLRGIEEDVLFSQWESIHRFTAEEAILNWDIHTSSFFYRKETQEYTKYLPRVWCGDYAIVLFAFSMGEVICLPYVMSVYNFGNKEGVTMKTRSNDRIINGHKGRKTFLIAYDHYTDSKYHEVISKRIALINQSLITEWFSAVRRLQGNARRTEYKLVTGEIKKEFFSGSAYNYFTRIELLKIKLLCHSYKSFQLYEAGRQIKRICKSKMKNH